jgi:hypothetical protein
MKILTRADIRQIFHQFPTIHVPDFIDEVDFTPLVYISWIDDREDQVYLIYEINGQLEGIRGRWIRLGMRPFVFSMCDICHKSRYRDGILSISAQTRTLPPHLTYRSRAFHICANFQLCNWDMKNEKGIQKLFEQVLE